MKLSIEEKLEMINKLDEAMDEYDKMRWELEHK
jgi:hypothetical protein